MNYADFAVKYTRIHEPKHLHPERKFTKQKTIIFYETSGSDSNDPYYPVNTESNYNLFKKYKALAQQEKGVIIGGRLGDYAYYDMDKTILAALKCYERQLVDSTS